MIGILGLAIGAFVGWWLAKSWYDEHLADAVNEARQEGFKSAEILYEKEGWGDKPKAKKKVAKKKASKKASKRKK